MRYICEVLAQSVWMSGNYEIGKQLSYMKEALLHIEHIKNITEFWVYGSRELAFAHSVASIFILYNFTIHRIILKRKFP